MKEINLLPWKKKHFRYGKLEVSFLQAGLMCLVFLCAVFLTFFLAYQNKQLNLHKNILNMQLSSLSKAIEKLKKEKQPVERLKFTANNKKTVQFTEENPLEKYSIKQFKMVGFLQGGSLQKKWALLKLPNKLFYKVEINDALGLEKGHVVFVNQQKVVIRDINNKKIELNFNGH